MDRKLTALRKKLPSARVSLCASAKTLLTDALFLVYSTVEYCVPVWCHTAHARFITQIYEYLTVSHTSGTSENVWLDGLGWQNKMLAQYPCSQHLTQVVWWPRMVKGWTLSPGPVQSARKSYPNIAQRRGQSMLLLSCKNIEGIESFFFLLNRKFIVEHLEPILKDL